MISKRALGLSALVLMFGLIPSEVYFVAAAGLLALLMLRRGGRLGEQPFEQFYAPPLLLLCGLIFAAYSVPRDVVRDGWYVAKIFVIFQFGVLLGLGNGLGLRWVRYLAVCAAILSCYEIVQHLRMAGPISSRHVSMFSVFILPMTWFFWRARSLPDHVSRIVLTVPMLVTLVLAESRTAVVLLLLTTFGAAGAFDTGRRIVVSAATLLAGALVLGLYLQTSGDTQGMFWWKVGNSLNEVLFNEGRNRISMYEHWRGFEAYKAFLMFREAPLLVQLFGHGVGTRIDLGVFVTLGSEDYTVREIPILHNAYFMILVKYGLVGLVLFAAFLLSGFRSLASSPKGEGLAYSRIRRTAAVVLLITTVSIAGPFNSTSLDGVLLLYGFASGALLSAAQRPRIRREPVLAAGPEPA